MWLTDGFWVMFFGRWREAVCIHINSCTVMYTVINMQGAGGVSKHQKTREIPKTLNLQ